MSNKKLTKEDLQHLLQLLAASTFRGDAIDRIHELKQKLLALLEEDSNG